MDMHKYLVYAHPSPQTHTHTSSLGLHVALALYKLNPQHFLALMISIPVKIKSMYHWGIEQNIQYNL